MDLISVLRREAKAQAGGAASTDAAPTPTLSPEILAAFNLSGRVAVVTGAGGGIGRATARILAGAGAAVVCADVKDDGLDETVSSVTGAGGAARAVHCDVSSRAEVDALVEGAVAAHGRLDVMVNNAAVIVSNPVIDTSEEEFDRVLSVNLKGVLFGCQAAVRAMLPRQSGSIVNLASQAIDSPAGGMVSYAVSKAGVAQLTRTLAAEVGREGIRVNAIAPGFVPTPMTNRHFTGADGSVDEGIRDQLWTTMRNMLPLNVLGQPEDMAFAALYLASDASRFVTGQVIRPNGGGAMA